MPATALLACAAAMESPVVAALRRIGRQKARSTATKAAVVSLIRSAASNASASSVGREGSGSGDSTGSSQSPVQAVVREDAVVAVSIVACAYTCGVCPYASQDRLTPSAIVDSAILGGVTAAAFLDTLTHHWPSRRIPLADVCKLHRSGLLSVTDYVDAVLYSSPGSDGDDTLLWLCHQLWAAASAVLNAGSPTSQPATGSSKRRGSPRERPSKRRRRRGGGIPSPRLQDRVIDLSSGTDDTASMAPPFSPAARATHTLTPGDITPTQVASPRRTNGAASAWPGAAASADAAAVAASAAFAMVVRQLWLSAMRSSKRHRGGVTGVTGNSWVCLQLLRMLLRGNRAVAPSAVGAVVAVTDRVRNSAALAAFEVVKDKYRNPCVRSLARDEVLHLLRCEEKAAEHDAPDDSATSARAAARPRHPAVWSCLSCHASSDSADVVARACRGRLLASILGADGFRDAVVALVGDAEVAQPCGAGVAAVAVALLQDEHHGCLDAVLGGVDEVARSAIQTAEVQRFVCGLARAWRSRYSRRVCLTLQLHSRARNYGRDACLCRRCHASS